GGEEDGPAIGASGDGVVLVVLVRARQVHDVRAGPGIGRVVRVRRGVDVVVIGALRVAVPGAGEPGRVRHRVGHFQPGGLHGRGRSIADRVVAAEARAKRYVAGGRRRGGHRTASDADVHA